MRLSQLPGLHGLRKSNDGTSVTVEVENPLELYERLAQWAAVDGINIQEVTGQEGDISALFQILVSKHRGISTTKGAVA